MCADQSHADFGPGQMHSRKWNFGSNFTRALYDDYYILFTILEVLSVLWQVYQLYYELVLFCKHIDCRSVIENNILKRLKDKLSTHPKNK